MEERGIQMLIDEFKNYRIDDINNTILQCEIQQYLLHAELIRYLKLWNFKFNELNRILEQVNNFNLMQWTQIRLDDFISKSQKKQSIFSYLDQFQQKIFQLEDLKDNYMKQTITKLKFDGAGNMNSNLIVQPKQSQFVQEILPPILKNQGNIFNKIKENDLFKSKQKNESPHISLCELFLREGNFIKYYKVTTKNQKLSWKFYKMNWRYIRVYKLRVQISNVQKVMHYHSNQNKDPQESTTIEALRLIELSIQKNNKYPKLFLIKDIYISIQIRFSSN
ncbi:hypothetical protein pb186bvf_002053 [Paramecium bursaria]